MNRRSEKFRKMVLTASLVSLAVAIPLIVAVPLSVASELTASGPPRAEVATERQSRADALVKMVSQAARQFCSPHVNVLVPLSGPLGGPGPETGLVLEISTPVRPATLPAQPQLIDLPPPLR